MAAIVAANQVAANRAVLGDRAVLADRALLADPDLPKLLLDASPGAVIGPAEVAWWRDHGRC
ncbi:hypothetical protein E1261_26040 [Kribbella albertanoniae]|uniref:Uncharacterized protein n=1 Tax=Kribbella albertanoniae TaxID=1266829 RepID=A0A4R4PQG0_9ACTN|nr:hypothetical protein E1261_26040 [Kribbella albertanoniae]